jgi:pimeloyl-ACP methyl ester carboxylesterase
VNELTHGWVEVEPGVRLHYVEAGHGPLVVLLHGFPEFWFSWRHQLATLSAAGFRAVAVDQRGYNLSDKPQGLGSYRIDRLAGDVARLIAGLGAERAAALVGHDWGGAIAWTLAMHYPDRLERLAILNAPHPGTFVKHLANPMQLRKSWYIFFFQLPWLPEAVLRANNFGAIRRQLPEREYVEALQRPGALTAALNYYRAMWRVGPAAWRSLRQRIDQPVLVIWGERDQFLRPALAVPDPRLVPHAQVTRLAEAGHWVQLDRPERVNELLITFLRGS